MDVTITDVILIVWAGVASGLAWYYKTQARIRGILVHAAAMFTVRMFKDTAFYEEVRQDYLKKGQYEVKLNDIA